MPEKRSAHLYRLLCSGLCDLDLSSSLGMNETNSTAANGYDVVSSSPNSFDVPIMALSLTVSQIVFRLCVVCVGMVLNCALFLVVSCSRQLRYPRHIFWAAVSLVDCLFLTQCVLELAVIVNHDRLACRFNVFLAFTDYSLLLLVLSLAALDRYLAIAFYERYKRSVTNRGVVLVLLSTSTLTFAIITSPFWTGSRSVHSCTINLTQMHWVFIWNFILGIVCVVLHVIIFVTSRAIIRKHFPNRRQPPITLRFVNNPSVGPPADLNSANARGDLMSSTARGISVTFPQENNAREDDSQLPPSFDGVDTNCFFRWMQGRSKVSRLELQTTISMSINVLPFWLCTFPISCASIAIYWCIQLRGDCTILGQIMLYLRDAFLLHTIYNPVMYMCSSSEFWRALRHFAWKVTNGCVFHADVNAN